MALGGRNCPHCRCYNALEDETCVRCGRWIPPAAIAWILREPLLTELWATKLLALVSILVFSCQLAAAGWQNAGFLRGMSTAVIIRFGGLTNGLEWTEPWRLLAACFVHMGVLHVGMNLLAFAELGRVAELEFKGPRLVLAYVLTGIAGFVVSTWWYGSAPYVTAGASGAVFGIDGLLIGDLVAKGDRRWRDALVRTIVHSFVFYFVLSTNQAAHLGGLLVGLGLGFLYGRESRPWRIAKAVDVAAVASIVAVVLSILLSVRSPAWRRFVRVERQDPSELEEP